MRVMIFMILLFIFSDSNNFFAKGEIIFQYVQHCVYFLTFFMCKKIMRNQSKIQQTLSIGCNLCTDYNFFTLSQDENWEEIRVEKWVKDYFLIFAFHVSHEY